MTWCAETKQFVCITCGINHRFIREPFWQWDGYYAIGCEACGVRHPALDRLEFQGDHPWQLHPKMRKTRAGLSPEKDIHIPSRRVLPPGEQVSEKEIAAAWDSIADHWLSMTGEFGDVNRQYVIDPVISRLLGQVEGKQILDAGCGSGYLSRLLAKRGAHMTGVDISAKAIDFAKAWEIKKPLGISYHVGSLSDLSMFPDQTFDGVVSNMVLQDLQDLDGAIEELQRVLKTNGQLIVSFLHPCFLVPGTLVQERARWVKRPIDSLRKEDRLFFKIDRYFDRTTEVHHDFGDEDCYWFHRPLSDYITTLVRQGFLITAFEEPVPNEKAIEEQYVHFGNEYDRIPFFLIIAAEKK